MEQNRLVLPLPAEAAVRETALARPAPVWQAGHVALLALQIAAAER